MINLFVHDTIKDGVIPQLPLKQQTTVLHQTEVEIIVYLLLPVTCD